MKFKSLGVLAALTLAFTGATSAMAAPVSTQTVTNWNQLVSAVQDANNGTDTTVTIPQGTVVQVPYSTVSVNSWSGAVSLPQYQLTVNANAQLRITGGGTIEYAPSFANISSTAFSTLFNVKGSLWLNNVTIDGSNTTTNGNLIRVSSGSLTLNDATVEGATNTRSANSLGGAIVNDGGTVTATDSTLKNNKAVAGGAIMNMDGTVNVQDSTFTNNEAVTYAGADSRYNGVGGAIYGMGGTISVAGGTFTGNMAVSGGAIGAYSGDLTVDNATITNNTATSNGGGIYTASGVDPVVTNTTISENSAPNGGGVYVSDGNWKANAVTMNKNTATDGGALFVNVDNGNAYTATFDNTSVLTGNTATGGALVWAGLTGTSTCKFTLPQLTSGSYYYNGGQYSSVTFTDSSGHSTTTPWQVNGNITTLTQTGGIVAQ